mgnify:CR=1 FL=1
MQPSRIRQKLNAGELIITAKSNFQSPDVLEMYGRTGFDGIWLCQEHAQYDPSSLYHLIRACRLGNTDAIIRMKPGNYSDLIWVLEAGARGIMVPRVQHVDEARWIAKAMKFPPRGDRGLDGVGPEADFGLGNLKDYLEEANRESFLLIQIEDPEVIPHIDSIAATPDVDVLFVGPGDLSTALGDPGNPDNPKVIEIMKAVVAACAKHGKTAGVPAVPGTIEKYMEMGFRFFNLGSDYRFITAGLNSTREELGKRGITLGS